MNILTKGKALKGSPTVIQGTIAFAVIDDRHIIKHDLVKYIVETYTENTVYNFYCHNISLTVTAHWYHQPEY